MGEISHQETVATVSFNSAEQAHVGEKEFKATLTSAKNLGVLRCGATACEMEARLDLLTATYACRKIGCASPQAVAEAASAAIYGLQAKYS